LVDTPERALSCGSARARMLRGDLLAPGEEKELTPLFRDPATGKEMAHTWAGALLREALIAVGQAEVATGQYSLRRGGGITCPHVRGTGAATVMPATCFPFVTAVKRRRLRWPSLIRDRL
jgi:hypothetical protein